MNEAIRKSAWQWQQVASSLTSYLDASHVKLGRSLEASSDSTLSPTSAEVLNMGIFLFFLKKLKKNLFLYIFKLFEVLGQVETINQLFSDADRYLRGPSEGLLAIIN